MENNNKLYFKAFIRVVKSIIGNEQDSYINRFDTVEVVREPLIIAKDKAEVKSILLEKYPQFFQNGKVYEKETKDQAQFFYVVIFPLYNYEIELINKGNWVCASCGQVHENEYVSRPKTNDRMFGTEIKFCRSDNDYCLSQYFNNQNDGVELPDDQYYIKAESLNYIYKCTEKATGKCYIGKTRNAPFFRWWNHLQHSSSPFGIYLRKTKLSDWSFEVLEVGVLENDVLRIESEYILKYDSINNGFNTLISNKSVIKATTESTPTLF